MSESWANFWSSKPRAIVAGLAASIAVASALYAFNWYSFYDTRSREAASRAEEIAADLALLAASASGPDPTDDARETMRAYLARREALVSVTVVRGDATLFSETRPIELDPDRSLVEKAFELPVEGRPGDVLHIGVREAVRPPFLVALGRAFSFSLLDYRRDPAAWWAQRLLNRSLPLYGYWLVVMVVGYPGLRALHLSSREILTLTTQTRNSALELSRLRDQHVEQIRGVQARIATSEAQRQEVELQRKELAAEVARVERRYDGTSAVEEASLGATTTMQRLEAIGERKGEVEAELRTHDEQIDRLEGDLSSLRTELQAAEELLVELEERGGGMASKLRDRNREIRRLQSLLQRAQHVTQSLSRTDLRLESDDREALMGVATRLESQLARWLRTSGAAQVNFSEHSRAVQVREQFERIDRAFIDRFFTHVVNPEYERGARRLIRVKRGPDGETPATGEIVVALDDDMGRTLGLRYELRKDAPDAGHVGFVLALLLRAHCRDFRGFEIRTR